MPATAMPATAMQGNPETAQDNMTKLIAAGVPSVYPSLHYPTTGALENGQALQERDASDNLLFQKIWKQRVDIEARSALIQSQIACRQFKAAERSASMLINIIEGATDLRNHAQLAFFILSKTRACGGPGAHYMQDSFCLTYRTTSVLNVPGQVRNEQWLGNGSLRWR